MPLELFKHRTFLLTSLIGFIVGISLYGSMTFLPLYLQVVKGSSPSEAGMQLPPLMGGLLVMSVVSGRVISRLGKYRFFPIAGTLLVSISMILLATLEISSPLWLLYLYTSLLGAGLGMVLQVLVLAVQNTVAFKHMGVATSGVTLFRSIGGSVGVAAFGAVFSGGLHARLATLFPQGAGSLNSINATTVHQLPEGLRDQYLQAFAGSLHMVYFAAACVVVLAFALAWLIEDVPLRDK